MGAHFNALIADVYACVIDPSGWGDILPRVARSFGGHAAALQRQRRGDPTLEMTHASGLDPDWVGRYVRDWDDQNPWRIRSLAHGWSQPAHMRHTAIHVSRLVPPAEIRSGALFNECLAPADLYDCIGMPLFAGDDALWIAVFCGRKKDVFSDDDVAFARALAAHIGRAAHAGARIADARRAPKRSNPSVVFEDAAFVAWNAAAHSTAQTLLDPDRISGVAVAARRACALFLKRDRDLMRRSQDGAALALIDLDDGAFLTVLRPRKSRARAPLEYIVFFDRDPERRAHAERVADGLSLSLEDAGFALLIAEGHAPEEVSRRVGGGVLGVRARLLRLFERLQIRSQPDLVDRVFAATRVVGLVQAS